MGEPVDDLPLPSSPHWVPMTVTLGKRASLVNEHRSLTAGSAMNVTVWLRSGLRAH